jgi:hypothetical protein
LKERSEKEKMCKEVFIPERKEELRPWSNRAKAV